ncbi:hypothetical protein BDV96DRAFT_27432 [Lophiotrema nucula]|uniref:Uncharacterized protein n=1 Tax=Lophiotrema nucula TaxID=690887 RepID=A0A6A5ZB90_9PLEO|nr:hypothetical protein BDV96DRAFT_27432 [Lophiotrema nucula]
MASQSHPVFTIIEPPTRRNVAKPSVILYGSMEKAGTVDISWRDDLTSSLSDLPVTVINPLNKKWDKTWEEDITFTPFKEQVEWEMDYGKLADVIVFYFVPGSEAPIALLELGMYAGTGKVVCCCPEGFWKRGNVQIVCERYGISLVGSTEELKDVVRARMERALKDSSESERRFRDIEGGE